MNVNAPSPSGEGRGGGRSIEAILFDLGGVLIELDWDRVFEHWASCCDADAAALRGRFSFDAPYERHEVGEISAREYFEALRRSLGIDISNDEFRAGWERVFAGRIEPTLELVRRIDPAMPRYIFSNTNAAHHAAWAHDYAEVLAAFRRTFTSYELGVRKPEREAFERIAREIHVPVERILFLDDTESNVAGARRAGLAAVHVRSPGDVEEALRPWLRAG